MTYDGTTIDYLKEHGTMATSIIIEKKNFLVDVYIEDEQNNKKRIAQDVDFVNIEGITKDNDVYHITMISEGEIYIADDILYKESIEEQFKTLTLLIPIF